MNSELQICSYEQAKRLKELGFDWICYTGHYSPSDEGVSGRRPIWPHKQGFYDVNSAEDSNISAPSVALGLKWLRDVKAEIFYIFIAYDQRYYYRRHRGLGVWKGSEPYNTFEEAESALLTELLKIYI